VTPLQSCCQLILSLNIWSGWLCVGSLWQNCQLKLALPQTKTSSYIVIFPNSGLLFFWLAAKNVQYITGCKLYYKKCCWGVLSLCVVSTSIKNYSFFLFGHGDWPWCQLGVLRALQRSLGTPRLLSNWPDPAATTVASLENIFTFVRITAVSFFWTKHHRVDLVANKYFKFRIFWLVVSAQKIVDQTSHPLQVSYSFIGRFWTYWV